MSMLDNHRTAIHPAGDTDPHRNPVRVTPIDYPFTDWAPETGKDAKWFVPVSRREEYRAANVNKMQIQHDKIRRQADDAFGPRGQEMPYDELLHRSRLAEADRMVKNRQHAAEYARIHVRPCPVCGLVSDDKYWRDLKAGAVPDLPGPRRVCAGCVTLVEDELRAGYRLPDGRTRREAAAEFVNHWAARKADAS
ncbi:hypothetical protein ACX9R5_13285 [Rathayibacter sp. CAU 1779]